MTDEQIIDLLFQTGHLLHPFGSPQEVPPFAGNLPLTHPAIEQAVRSYQDFMVQDLEPLVMAHYSRPARLDGVTGPATRELFDLPRCGCADYGEDVQPMIGTGSWKGCHGVGEFHAATMYVDRRNMPKFWEPIFDEVWNSAAAAYAEIGFRWTLTDDKASANTVLSWEPGRKPWIGLAVVGNNEQCNSPAIWLKLLASYQPDNVVAMETELLMHEEGHNLSLQHSRGGIMNPSIMRGLAPTWKGDPSESILRRLYGGEPVGGPTPPPRPPPPPMPGPTDLLNAAFGIDDTTVQMHLSLGHDAGGITIVTKGGVVTEFDNVPRATTKGKP